MNESNTNEDIYNVDDIFEIEVNNSTYDLVYDSGCFHHLPPHQRLKYLDLLSKALKSNGFFGLTCFAPGGGSDISDWEVYRKNSLQGGLSYTEEKLKKIFSKNFEVIEFRKMKEIQQFT
ncbi:MAG: class I SAM-dependent methyltransferase [Halanaerobiales bacterium]|nr:class I SAM-dependent methyltransferase [Halanaerobiales bacterium]